MSKKFHEHQSGAVSMITVIFLAIILTVLTTSFIRLTIDEQREAIDNDLTTRAYYAAESGVQDAITALRTRSVTPIANPTECAPHSGDGVLSVDADGKLDTQYTCQLIDLNPPDYQAFLKKYKSEFFKLDDGGLNSVKAIRVGWHLKGGTGTEGADFSGTLVRRLAGNTALPTEAVWTSNDWPAMIRLQVVSVPTSPAGAVINRDSIKNFIVFLNPTNAGAGLHDITTPALNAGIDDASCDLTGGDGEWVCEYTLEGLDDTDFDYYVRVQALYTSTHIKIEALNLALNPVSLENAQAVVDVTGRAGDVFRRVETRVNLSPDDLWPDYAITSAQDICKNFTITNVANDGGNADIVDFGDVNPNIGIPPEGASCIPPPTP